MPSAAVMDCAGDANSRVPHPVLDRDTHDCFGHRLSASPVALPTRSSHRLHGFDRLPPISGKMTAEVLRLSRLLFRLFYLEVENC
jgi:hypothetical protein